MCPQNVTSVGTNIFFLAATGPDCWHWSTDRPMELKNSRCVGLFRRMYIDRHRIRFYMQMLYCCYFIGYLFASDTIKAHTFNLNHRLHFKNTWEMHKSQYLLVSPCWSKFVAMQLAVAQLVRRPDDWWPTLLPPRSSAVRPSVSMKLSNWLKYRPTKFCFLNNYSKS